jgi:putative ABC transport system ATP-binding protein
MIQPKSTAVRLLGLTKTYRSGATEQVILSRVDLCIDRGQFIVVLGRSGSGKSTLLNLLGAMDRPSAGRIMIDGTDISTMAERERTRFRRRALGFIFQAYNLIPTLSVIENVKLPLVLNHVYDDEPALRLLEELAIAHKADAWAADLSGGEQQRVAIARALVHAPNLILADEPTGNLDVDTGRDIIRLLDDLVRRSGHTLIMATHSQEVIGYADRVLTIRDRKLVDL